MATLQQLIDNFLGTSVTTNLSEEVRKGLSQGTPLTDLAGASKTPRTSSPTGSRAIDRMPVSGEMRQASELRRGPQPRPQGGSMPLKTVPLTLEQMAQRRAQNPGTPAMSEFAGADMPLPFGRFGQVTEPAQSEFVNATSPMPTPGDLPGSDENEELFADNIALSLLQDLPANPAARAANQAKADAAKGLAFGTQLAKAQNQEGLISQAADTISGLLGNVDFKGLFRVLARPEFVAPMGPGQSPLTNFINAAAADRTSQAALRAARQEAGLEGFKAETDRLKALMPDYSKMPKLTAEVNKMYDQLAASQSMAEIGDKIRVSLDKSFAATGGPSVAAEGLRAVAAMFGANIEVEVDDINLRTAELKRMILEGKVFGREANKQELEILSKLVQGPGFTTNKTQILNALDALTKQAEKRSFNITNRLQAFGMQTDFTNKRPSSAGFVRNQQSQ